jgi:hypothetical protein
MPPPAPPRPRDIEQHLLVLGELRQLLDLAYQMSWAEAQIELKPLVLKAAKQVSVALVLEVRQEAK